MHSELTTDSNYQGFIKDIKSKIKSAQIKAALAVNEEGINLYREIGREIVSKQETHNWGSKLIEQLSNDIKSEFPNQTGYSRSNLFYMRKFYLFYKDQGEIVQRSAGQIPWRHHQLIMDKISDIDTAIFYIKKTAEMGWSRDVLAHHIASNLYGRQGQAVNNLTTTLPQEDSEMMNQLVKSPYVFDILGLGEEHKERDLQKALMQNITQFLLELGTGFAFVGQYYRLELAGEELEIDLLFYHMKANRYLVVELKTTKFDASFLSKLGIYMEAVDQKLLSKVDKPSVGLLICKEKNDLFVEYALKQVNAPIIVADYKLNQELEMVLPSKEEIEAIVDRTLDQVSKDTAGDKA